MPRDLLQTLNQFAEDHGYEWWPTSGPHDAAELGQRAVDEGIDRLIVAGGDGTIGQVINGLAPHFAACELAILPLGTGNDLARSLGLGPDRLEQAVDAALHGTAVPVDVIRFQRGEATAYAINAATGGFGGKVASDVQQHDKQRWGAFAYWLTAVTQLTQLQEFNVTLTIHGRRERHRTYGLEIGNGRFVGGGFPIAPHALLDDGKLDITVIPVLPTLELLAAGFNFALSPGHHDDRLVTYQAEHVEIDSQPDMLFSVDGEPVRAISAGFHVIPQAVRVVAGPDAALGSATQRTGKGSS